MTKKQYIYAEAETKQEEKERWQKMYDYALKEKWEGQINDILEVCFKKNIKIKL